MVDVHVDTGFSRPSVRSQATKRVPVRETDDPIITFEDEAFVGFAGRGDTCGHLAFGRDLGLPTDRRVQHIRAINRNAGGRILRGSRTHKADARLHASSLPPSKSPGVTGCTRKAYAARVRIPGSRAIVKPASSRPRTRRNREPPAGSGRC